MPGLACERAHANIVKAACFPDCNCLQKANVETNVNFHWTKNTLAIVHFSIFVSISVHACAPILLLFAWRRYNSFGNYINVLIEVVPRKYSYTISNFSVAVI